MEFEHNLGRSITDEEILALLRNEHPEKKFSIGRYGEIIEEDTQKAHVPTRTAEYRSHEVDLRDMRVAKLGFGATAPLEDLERMMTSSLS